MLEATILLFKEEKPAFADEVKGQMYPLSRASLRYLYMANLSWLERENRAFHEVGKYQAAVQ